MIFQQLFNFNSLVNKRESNLSNYFKLVIIIGSLDHRLMLLILSYMLLNLRKV